MILNQYRLLINDKEVMRGSQAELSQKLGVSRNSFYHAARGGHLLLETYRIEMLEPAPRKSKSKEVVVERKKTKKELEIESIVNEFKKSSNRTRNTITMFDPTPYFPDLLDMGYDCRIAGIYDNTDGRIVTKQHRNKGVHYVVEYVI